MIYKFFISIVLIALGLYYLVCFLEIFGLIKWSSTKDGVQFPKMLIPFYYFFKTNKQNDTN